MSVQTTHSRILDGVVVVVVVVAFFLKVKVIINEDLDVDFLELFVEQA